MSMPVIDQARQAST